MELTTEINKIFGQEMAKLYAEKIREEDLVQKAIDIWHELNKTQNEWGDRRKSKFEIELEGLVMARFGEACKKILDTEEVKADIERQSKDIIAKIREETERKIIDRTSDVLARMYGGNEFGYGLKGAIQETVMEMSRH